MSDPEGGGPTVTVLVVDDDRKTRALIRMLLQNEGYEVLEAVHGQEAVEILAQQPDRVELVLLDLVMPHMSGEDCLERLLELRPELKVIAITAYTLDDEAYERISSRVQALLPKPIRPPLMLKLIQRVLAGEQAT